jgi:hypothetical protein
VSLFPFPTEYKTAYNTTKVLPSSIREYEMDFVTERLTGNIVEGVDALCVWAYLALKAKRYRWVIYSWQYGEEYTNLIGYSHSDSYLQSEVRRYMEECLFENEHIKAVEELSVSQIKDKLYIRFKLVTDVGTKEVAFSV